MNYKPFARRNLRAHVSSVLRFKHSSLVSVQKGKHREEKELGKEAS